MCVCYFFFLPFFHPAWLYSHCQGHYEVICFPFSCLLFFFFLLCTSHVRGLKFKHRKKNKKKNRFNVALKDLRPSIQTARRDGLGVIHSPLRSALLCPQTSPKTPRRTSAAAADRTHYLATACTSATWGTPPKTPQRKRRSTACRVLD